MYKCMKVHSKPRAICCVHVTASKRLRRKVKAQIGDLKIKDGHHKIEPVKRCFINTSYRIRLT